MPSATRRQFIIGGAAALTTAVLAACSKKSDSPKNAGPGSTVVNKGLALLESTNLLYSGETQRIAFVVQRDGQFITPTNVELSVRKLDDKGAYTPLKTKTYSDTEGAPPYLVTTHTFASPGNYFVRAKLNGQSTESPIQVIKASDSKVPQTGQDLPKFDSPTTKDHRGVNPICTRSPQCPLHEQTITQAIDGSGPTVVTFATPEFCESATCGPILDIVLAIKSQFPKIGFVHSEIYTDKTLKHQTPAVKAYNLVSEPVIFLANSNGKIANRIDGLIGKAELTKYLSELS